MHPALTKGRAAVITGGANGNRRIPWAAEDLIRNRPALSRWHPDYADEFAEFLTLEAPFRR